MSASNALDLPEDFLFGVATAAYQIEGGVAQGQRGTSIWDTFSHTPGKTKNGDTGDIACDHYHLWSQDLDLMQSLGIKNYRLNFSWVRLQPSGQGPLNDAGVKFYRDLLLGCHLRGIRPLVTIYHWDLPQDLQDAGGWPNRETAYLFAAYTKLLIQAFKDLVEDWITINEPWCIAFLGHSWGVQAPGFKDEALAVKASHHVLLAHGLALAEFRSSFPEARVGLSNILCNAEPKTSNSQDVAAAARVDARMNKLFLNPVFKGFYGDEVIELFGRFGLNEIEDANQLVQPGDLVIISQTNDFVGINHYHNMVVSYKDGAENDLITEQATPNHQSSWNWSNTPWALEKILLRVNADYTSLPIYVTENGITLDDYSDPEGQVLDPDRIDYLNGYITAVANAIRAGVPVQGYFAWSFLDNFEWAEGYSKRFGLVYVDYPTQTRTPKSSAYWYQSLISEHDKRALAK